jgi:hypothetical protein
MRVKSQHYLQPTVVDAHSVIIEDALGNIIYVAVEVENGQIVTAQAGEPNFPAMLKALGITKVTHVTDVKTKTVEDMKGLF